MFASTVLVVVWKAVCLTGYSDYLTSFCESLSPPYGHDSGLKNDRSDVLTALKLVTWLM